MSAAVCKACAEPILWAVTERGRRMPLNAQPQRLWTLDGESQDGPLCRSTLVYTSHWATCPEADRFRSDR